MGRSACAAAIAIMSLALGAGSTFDPLDPPDAEPNRAPGGAPDGAGEKLFRPVAVFQGTHSRITKETFRLIRTPDAWKQVWEEHRGAPGKQRFTESDQALGIDFENHLVVAIFAGPCDWCDVTPRLRADTVVIGFWACVNQTEGRPLGAGGPPPDPAETAKEKAQAPYAFVVLRKPVRTVVIEQDVRRELPSPPVWKQRTTFSDLAGMK